MHRGIQSYEERVATAERFCDGDQRKAYDYLKQEHSSAIDRWIAAKPDKISLLRPLARLRQRRISNWLAEDLYGASQTSSRYYYLTFGSGRSKTA